MYIGSYDRYIHVNKIQYPFTSPAHNINSNTVPRNELNLRWCKYYVQYLAYSVFGETQLSCTLSFWNKIWLNENAPDSFSYSIIRNFCAYES